MKVSRHWSQAWPGPWRSKTSAHSLVKMRCCSKKTTGLERKLVGLVLQDRGVLRPGQRIVTDAGEGVTTSGSFSPTLQKAIAFARIPKNAMQSCQVDIRGKLLNCNIVRPPFARNGSVCEGII